jgi:hypothetical protein
LEEAPTASRSYGGIGDAGAEREPGGTPAMATRERRRHRARRDSVDGAP